MGARTTRSSSRASSSSSSPTGSPSPAAQDGRFGEERLRAELGGAAGPVQAVQRLEGALQSFTGGSLEDDVAILALAPASAESRAGRGLSIASAEPAAGATGFGAGRG